MSNFKVNQLESQIIEFIQIYDQQIHNNCQQNIENHQQKQTKMHNLYILREYFKINYFILLNSQKLAENNNSVDFQQVLSRKATVSTISSEDTASSSNHKIKIQQLNIIPFYLIQQLQDTLKNTNNIIEQEDFYNQQKKQEVHQLVNDCGVIYKELIPQTFLNENIYISQINQDQIINIQDNNINQLQNNKQQQDTLQKYKNIFIKYQKQIELGLAFIFTLILPIFIAPIINSYSTEITTIFYIALPMSFLVGMAIGGNDISNSMGLLYGSQTLNMVQVIILGIVFESLGSILLGENVAKTISSQIVHPQEFDNLNLFSLGMTAVLSATAFSSLTVTVYGLPISITQGVVFSMAAVGLVSCGEQGINLQGVVNILLVLVGSPLIGLILAFLIYIFIIYFIIDADKPQKRILAFLPVFGFLNIFVVSYLVIEKGVQIQSFWTGIIIACSLGIIGGLILFIITLKSLNKLKLIENLDQEQDKTAQIGNYFKPLLIISACCVSFTHGSNDVSNAIGPLAAILAVYNKQEEIQVPLWMLIFGAVAFSFGIVLLGQRSIKTMGTQVSTLNKVKSSTVLMGTAIAILLSSVFGMPVSTSHCTVGSIIGATFSEKIMDKQYSFNKKSLNKIFASWIYTIPFVFFIAIYSFYTLKGAIL